MSELLKLSKIGNSRGVRLPKRIIQRYGFEKEILIEEMDDALVLKPVKSKTNPMLSWEDTFKQMGNSDEDWSDWDVLDENEHGHEHDGADWE